MIELVIESLSDDLRGLARHRGKVAFVAGALPGETVAAEREREHRRFDEYRVVEVRQPAPARVAPACPLVGQCGGCDLQHVSAEHQLVYKSDALLELLRRQAGLTPGHVDPPIGSAPFGYRRRARLSWYVPRRGPPRLGFRALRERTVVDVPACPVLVPELAALPGVMNGVLKRLAHPREVGHLELSLSESADQAAFPVVHVHGVGALRDADRGALEQFAVDQRAYLSHGTADDGSFAILHQPATDPIGYRLPDFALRIGYRPGDFLQANAKVNRQLVAQVVDWLTPHGGQLLEGFAGIGNLSLALARAGFDVLGLEAVPEMVVRARDNAAAHGLEARFEVRDLAQRVETDAISAAPETVVLNPPRAGAAAFMESILTRSPPARILYVSCAPPTLARDAARLASAGYRLTRLSLVDMLPQTRHTESMALFEAG